MSTPTCSYSGQCNSSRCPVHGQAAAEADGRRALAEPWWTWVPCMLIFDALGNTHRLTEDDDIDGVLMMTSGLHGYALPVMGDPQTSRLAKALRGAADS